MRYNTMHKLQEGDYVHYNNDMYMIAKISERKVDERADDGEPTIIAHLVNPDHSDNYKPLVSLNKLAYAGVKAKPLIYENKEYFLSHNHRLFCKTKRKFSKFPRELELQAKIFNHFNISDKPSKEELLEEISSISEDYLYVESGEESTLVGIWIKDEMLPELLKLLIKQTNLKDE